MRSTYVNPSVTIMTRNCDSEVQELSPEELKLLAGGSLIENALKLMGEVLKTRSEISMTFARNARA
jgi:hypothetical protein